MFASLYCEQHSLVWIFLSCIWEQTARQGLNSSFTLLERDLIMKSRPRRNGMSYELLNLFGDVLWNTIESCMRFQDCGITSSVKNVNSDLQRVQSGLLK
ncbi:hypothetical protein NPIL_551581 [Nephila pilipes]|uniref:Uncharacterized protein n=1 Tax=Nephila pilipes TaxID=299642 RepID=A0A8X6I881_NEPPI|nr:hypothetical protein NPIL_551581 [Nephila pilipes]